MDDYTEVDAVTIGTAQDLEIVRDPDHIVSIRFTSHGQRREVQIASYGEPLSIYVEGVPPVSTPDL